MIVWVVSIGFHLNSKFLSFDPSTEDLGMCFFFFLKTDAARVNDHLIYLLGSLGLYTHS